MHPVDEPPDIILGDPLGDPLGDIELGDMLGASVGTAVGNGVGTAVGISVGDIVVEEGASHAPPIASANVVSPAPDFFR